MAASAKPKFTDRGLETLGRSGTRRVGHQFELARHPAELGKRTGLHLLHRSAAMNLHGRLGDADIVGNLFAQAAARHWTTLCGPLRVPRKCMNPFACLIAEAIEAAVLGSQPS